MSRKEMKKRRQQKIQEIEQTAAEVFSEKGYNGATTNEIAERAGISKRSMYYYAGDKDNLYKSVIKNLTDVSMKLVEYKAAANHQAAHQKMDQYIWNIAQVSGLKNLHSIALRELLFSGEQISADILLTVRHGLKIVQEIIVEGNRNREYSEDVNPLVLGIMILSFFVYWNLIVPHLHKAGFFSESIEAIGEPISMDLVQEVQKIVAKALST